MATLMDRAEGRQALPEEPIRVSLKFELEVDLIVDYEVEVDLKVDLKLIEYVSAFQSTRLCGGEGHSVWGVCLHKQCCQVSEKCWEFN